MEYYVNIRCCCKKIYNFTTHSPQIIKCDNCGTDIVPITKK